MYSSNNENDFEEVTPKETIRLVQAGLVNGLKIVDGEVVPDIEGFNQENIKIKSGVGRYRNMIETGKQSNTGYSVISKTLHDFEESYQLVTSKCGRFDCDTERLKMLCNFADVAGVRLNNDGEIELCEGVEVLDFRTIQDIKNCDLDAVVDVGGKLMKVSEIDNLSADELTSEHLFSIDTKNGNSFEGVEPIEAENTKSDITESVAQPTAIKKPASKSTGKRKS